MADVNTAIYRPLSPPQGGLGQMTPLSVLQLIGQVQQNAIQKQELDSRRAVGNIYNLARDPVTGKVDPEKLQSLAPTVGVLAPEITRNAVGTASDIAGLNVGYQQKLRSIFGQLATDPNVTPEKISAAKIAAAAAGVPGAVIQQYVAQIPQNPKAQNDFFTSQANLAQGPEYYSKGVTVPGPGGTPTQISEGLAARARNAAGLQVGLAPGQETQIAEPKQTFLADQEKSAQTQANLRQLNTVYPLVQELGNSNFGPGSAEFAKIKGALITAGVINPNTSDLQVRQEVGKYLLRYAQGAQNAGRSDHALSTAIGSNPNLDLTKPANLKLIRNQIGMDRADAAIPVLFNQLYPGDAGKSQYKTFKANFYRNYDQRAFTYDMLSPEGRRQLIDSLGKPGSPAYKKFAQSYNELKAAGFITPNAQ